MLSLIHGDNQVASRSFLERYRTPDTIFADAKNLSLSQIESLIQPSFISPEQTIVLENPKLDLLTNFADTPGINLVVWLSKTASKIPLSPKNWKITSFEVGYSKSLYIFIDTFFAKNLKATLQNMKILKEEGIPHELIIGSLNRQIVGLLTFNESGGQLTPFQRKKLSPLVPKWTKKELRALLLRLTQLDYRVKSGRLEPEIGLSKLMFGAIGKQ